MNGSERIRQGWNTDKYGVRELNGLANNSTYHEEDFDYIDFDELKDYVKSGVKVVSERLRYLHGGAFPVWELSYWHVRIKGRRYEVQNLPHGLYQVPRHKKSLHSQVVEIVKGEKIFIYNLCDSISIL